MIRTHTISPWAAVLTALLLVCACTAPPNKPPPPKPIVSDKAAQQGGPGAPPAGAPNSAQGGGPGSPGRSQGYGAASANAAEVEEVEVAADGSTRVISSTGHAAAAAPSAGHNGAPGGGSGGAAMQPSADDASGVQRGDSGGRLAPQEVHTTAPAMVGIQVQERDSSLGGAEDQGSEAARSGNPQGRVGGRGQTSADQLTAPDGTRLGVRGGTDERGVTSGSPPLASTPRATPSAPVAQDNDILAQQLREAAEKEKDPVLRGKLWVEYRKYKAGL